MMAISHNDLPARLRLAIVATLMAMHLVTPFLCSELPRYCPSTVLLKIQSTKAHADVAHFSPIFTPGIAHNPIRSFRLILPPTHHRNNVVVGRARLRHDSRFVVEHGMR